MDSRIVDHSEFPAVVEEIGRRFPKHTVLVFFNIEDALYLIDAFGHDAVDRIAADLAELIRAALPDCVVSVYGIDVAVVFAPGSGEQAPEVLVPRLIDTIHATPISLHGAPGENLCGWHIHFDAAETGVVHLSVKAGLIHGSGDSLVAWASPRERDDGTTDGAPAYYLTRQFDESGRLGRRSVRIISSDLTMPERITDGPFR